MEDHIDLIKGQPVVDQALVASEEGPAETFITFQHLATTPTSILSNQMHGTVKVGNGHQGFNAILMALLKEVFQNCRPASFGSSSSPLGKIRDQAMDKR